VQLKRGSSMGGNPIATEAAELSYDIYVDSVNGNDANRDFSAQNAYKTVAIAIDNIPKFLKNAVVKIHIVNGFDLADVTISGFIGGTIILHSGPGNISTAHNLIISGCTSQILVQNFNFISSGRLIVERCLDVDVVGCSIANASGAAGVEWYKTMGSISRCSISNRSVGILVSGGALYMDEVSGVNNTEAVRASAGAVVEATSNNSISGGRKYVALGGIIMTPTRIYGQGIVNIRATTVTPNPGDGEAGDLWVVYEEPTP